MRRWIPMLGVGLWLSACASAPAPNVQMAEAKADVRAAEAVNARGTPESALYLKLARDKMRRAQELIRKERMHEAALVLEQAQADAQLAAAMADANLARREAQQAEQQVQRLRGELE